MEFEAMIAAQRAYWNTGATRGVALRRCMLDKLETSILHHQKDLLAALHADLGKAPFESYACEVGLVLSELRFAKRHLEQWASPKKRPTPLALFPAKSQVLAEPYGVALILAPWNYPVQLTLVPLIAAVAAGNCAVVKPSAYAPSCSQAVAQVLREVFKPQYVEVVEGGRAENAALLAQKFDYIFFTGSTQVGRAVMTAAAQHLTPVTLELGGKSPVLLTADANVDLAAKRIAWGKFINAGQTCVAPDHVWLPRGMEADFVAKLQKYIRQFYGQAPLQSPDLPKIVNEKHFDRILGLIDREKTVIGGGWDRESRRIEPTVLAGVTGDDRVMGEEIFGPVLPLLTYETLGEVVAWQQQRPRPLALYLFTGDRALAERMMAALPSGGVCVNDVVMHLATSHLPFGGVGESGMGSCHGKAGFDTFTHYRAALHRGKQDVPLRYAPYKDRRIKLLERLL